MKIGWSANVPKEPNILYSTNCILANRICEQYYGGLHYVWCSTIFGSPSMGNVLSKNPASSTPYERYKRLEIDVGPPADIHSPLIASQRVGIKYGAKEKYKCGKISIQERDEIYQIADQADPSDFTPLLYLIPYEKVKSVIKRAPLGKRAHPLSDEWIIDELPTDYMDIQRL